MEGDAIDMKELLDILNKVNPGIDYVNEKHLVSDELIDSLDVMTIVTEICDEFDVEILPTDVVPENFESVEAMWRCSTRNFRAARILQGTRRHGRYTITFS